MAKPTGAISVGSVFYDLQDNGAGSGPAAANPQEMFFIWRAQLTHPDFETNNVPGNHMIHMVDRELEFSGGSSYSEYWYIGESVYGAFTDHPHTATTTGTHSDTQVEIPRVRADDIEMSFIVAKCKGYNDLAYGEVNLEHITFEAKNDIAYPGEKAELLKRSGDRLYAPDYPCSAWHIMKALMATHEKIMYESRPCFCVPMFGDAT